MKAIRTRLNITSLSARKDGSIGFRCETPELKPQEKTAFFELQNLELDCILNPLGVNVPEINIDKDLNSKSQSQRIKNHLFILFEKNKDGYENFEAYYFAKTEKYINYLKKLIED